MCTRSIPLSVRYDYLFRTKVATDSRQRCQYRTEFACEANVTIKVKAAAFGTVDINKMRAKTVSLTAKISAVINIRKSGFYDGIVERSAAYGCVGVSTIACMNEKDRRHTGRPIACLSTHEQLEACEEWFGRETQRFVVWLKLGNADGKCRD